MYTPAASGSLGGSARVSSVCPRQNWLIGVVSQGFSFISQPSLAIDLSFWYHDPSRLNKPYSQKTKQEQIKKKKIKNTLKVKISKKVNQYFFSFSHVLSFLFHDLTHWTNKTAEKLKKNSNFQKYVNSFFAFFS